MCTSRIAVLQKEDGSVKSVYCRHSGNLSGFGAGQTLLTHYDTYERANALVALGKLQWVCQYLDPLPEAPHAYSLNRTIKTHSMRSPQLDVTIAYHREGKRKFRQQIDTSVESFYKNEHFEEYNYLFMNEQWYVKNINFTDGEWVVLTEELISLENERPFS